MSNNTLMVHSISTNTLNNAARFSHNSIQGHHHSSFGVERYTDSIKLRWSMTVGCLLDPHSPAARYMAKAVLKRPILGVGLLLGDYNRLIISDLHLPYQHKDAFDFLWELEKHYKFDEVLNVGDVFDHHRGSYHESEPDAMGEEEEFFKAKKAAQELQHMFPSMVITQGNHDCIPQRKLKSCGLPASMLGDYNTMYDLDSKWEWVDRYEFDSKGAFPITHPMVLNSRGRWDKKILKT